MSSPPPLHLSRRTDFGLPDPRYEELHQLVRRHEKPLDLTISNPTLVGLDLPLERIDFARTPYRADPRGQRAAREAIASSYIDRKPVDPDQILLTSSTSEAYSFVLRALCDPGDAILVPEPSYPLFEQLAQLTEVRLLKYPIAYDGAFHFDLARLPEHKTLHRDRVRAVFCVSPNNPTGNSLTEDELQRLRDLHLPMIVDEVFRPYSTCHSAADPLSDADNSPLTIILDSLSKRCVAPDLKIAWMLARGRNAATFLDRVDWLSDAYLSVNAPAQQVLGELLQTEHQPQAIIKHRLEQCRATIQAQRIHELGITQIAPEAGWVTLLRFPATQSEDDWWHRLSTAGVWVQPGSLYGFGTQPIYALSLLTPPKILHEALGRIGRVVAEGTL